MASKWAEEFEAQYKTVGNVKKLTEELKKQQKKDQEILKR